MTEYLISENKIPCVCTDCPICGWTRTAELMELEEIRQIEIGDMEGIEI